jgi:hypothetical protein
VYLRKKKVILKGISILELIGYIAVAVLVYSIFVKNILRTRWLNFSGGLLLALYGFIIAAYPLLLLGIFSAVYNIYYILCVKFGKGEKFFRLIYGAKFYGRFAEAFVNHRKSELSKYFPDVDFEKLLEKEDKDLECCYVFRDLTPVGVFLFKKISVDTAEVIVDYVECKYSNLLESCFLTRGKEYLKDKRGIANLYTYTAVPDHVRLLEKQGFVRDSVELFKFTAKI